MSTGQEGQIPTKSITLPLPQELMGERNTWTLPDLARQLERAASNRGATMTPLKVALPGDLKDSIALYQAQLADPVDPTAGQVEHVLVATVEPWTQNRVDAFIAAMASARLSKNFPLFRFYSVDKPPAELHFLFETSTAGLFEIMVWDIMEEDTLSSDDCESLGAAGRTLLHDLYGVDLAADDLQWLSVVNQLVLDEFRGFSEDPSARMDEALDYVPHGSLMILGCVAGEAVRLNHEGELVWNDADGLNWPRLAFRGETMSLPSIDATFQRFEAGTAADLWQDYEVFFATGRLSPPVSIAAEINPLQFLPDWDPEPDTDLTAALDKFKAACVESGLKVEPHPHAPEDSLVGFLHAFTCLHNEEVYDLFLCTGAWTEERTHDFLTNYAHRSMEDWELGLSPVFVFFSAHPLTDLLEYCFVIGPPSAPLEGLAQVETPAPEIPNNDLAIENLGLWLLDVLERYTTIGLRLDSPSLIPGLEYFVREELRQSDEELTLDEIKHDALCPNILLIAVGLAVGSSLRLRDRKAHRWTFVEGTTWPQMQILKGEDDPEVFDWVAQAQAIWRGEADEFVLPEA